jgi:hypothetical protein
VNVSTPPNATPVKLTVAPPLDEFEVTLFKCNTAGTLLKLVGCVDSLLARDLQVSFITK